MIPATSRPDHPYRRQASPKESRWRAMAPCEPAIPTLLNMARAPSWRDDRSSRLRSPVQTGRAGRNRASSRAFPNDRIAQIGSSHWPRPCPFPAIRSTYLRGREEGVG
jgi:hypothetical protein